MRKTLLATLMGVAISSLLTGCILAPQTIALNEQYVASKGQATIQRDALVRVVDERAVAANVLGHRGGQAPEKSSLLADKPLNEALTTRMQTSLRALGFGADSPIEPLRVQLTVNEFAYQCNPGVVVNECALALQFTLTVLDGTTRFTKPYSAHETRSLAASPTADYNEKWVNELLDRVWDRMFNDAQLLDALKVVKQ